MKPNLTNPARFIEKHGRTLKLYECLMDITQGLASVVVSRRVPEGGFIAAFYLVDIYCLGLKSTGAKYFEEKWQYQAFIDDFKGKLENLAPATPMYAYNVIWGGIEYAEDNGIDIIDKDFKCTQYLIPAADKIDYIEFAFGENGKPLYISGPYDNAQAIIAKLTAKLGKDGFHYVSQIG